MQTVRIDHGFGIETEFQAEDGLTIEELCDAAIGEVNDTIVAKLKSPVGATQQWDVIPRDKWGLVKPRGDNLCFELTASGGQLLTLVFNAIITAGISVLAASLSRRSGRSAAATGSNDRDEQVANVDAEQNILAKGKRLSRVLGTRRVTPNDICFPHKYLQGGREVITKVVALDGNHQISDVKIGDVPIESIPDAQWEIKEGAEQDGNQSLVNVVTKPVDIAQKLTKFITEADTDRLADQLNPSDSEPKSVVFAPGFHERMTEVTLRIGLDPFVFLGASTVAQDVSQSIRMRFRKRGSGGAWTNLPEVSIRGRRATEALKEIRFRWDDNFGRATPSTDFQYSFINTVPEATTRTLSDGSSGSQWVADPHFISGASAANISPSGDGLNVLLDENTHPKDDYEFDIVAGLPVISGQFVPNTYTLNGVVESLFVAYDSNGSWQVPGGQEDASAGVTAQFSTMIVDLPPIARPGVAHIGLVLKDTEARNVNCIATGRFLDWSGSAWDTLTASNNPATIAYNLYKEWLEKFNVDTTLINSAQFVNWRAENILRDRTIATIADGQVVPELIDQAGIAGFATRAVDTGISMDYHRDRSAETPVMTFSHRDSRISIEKTYGESPKGIRADFDNKDDDWSEDDVTVNNRYSATPFSENEEKNYQPIDRLKNIRERADFDLLNAVYRDYTWIIQTGPAGHNRVKGELIGVVTDLLSDYSHGFFIRAVTNARTLVLDRPVPSVEQADFTLLTDLTTTDDILISGNASLAHIVTPTGTEQYSVADVNEDVLLLNEDLSTQDLVGSRITIAGRDELFHRAIILDNQRVSAQRCTLLAVPESPIIETELVRWHHDS